MTYEGVTASGFFTINEKGEIVQFEAERYGEFDGEYRLETWTARVSGYKDFHGFIIPSRGELIWNLDAGDFHWYRFEVQEMDYNQAVAF